MANHNPKKIREFNQGYCNEVLYNLFVFNRRVSVNRRCGGAGGVSGTIEDANGGVIPRSVVIITNQPTVLTRTAATTDGGQFNFPALQPDTYIVTVEKQGFSRIEQRDVQVTVGRTVTLQLELQPGEVSAVVTIESSPIIDITKTDESSLVTREQINELPINGRRADQFAPL